MQKNITAWLLAGLFFCCPTGSRSAGVAPPDAGQAQILEQQFSDLLEPVLGPQKRPMHLTPAGDHYAMEMPLAPVYEPLGIHINGGASVTGTLAPLDGGRWSIDSLALPSPTHFVMVTGTPDKPVSMTFDLTMLAQVSHNVIDPAFASPWSFNSSGNGFDMAIASTDMHQVTHVGPFSMVGALTPLPDNRLDVTQKFELLNYASDATMANGTHLQTNFARVGGSLHFERLDRVRMSNALSLVLSAKARQTDGKPLPQPELNALLHQLILALRDSAGGGGFSQTIDGIEFNGAAASFKLSHFTVGFEADAPAGMLGARMTLVMDGPSSPAIPPTALAYVPSHLALQPYISGIGLAELTQLALDATAQDPPRAADPSVMFAHGGLQAGIEHLEMSVGETALKGSAKFQAPSPDQVSGHATITASHFDALMKNVQKDQVLGPQALPVLLLVRGLAKLDGDDLVWEIAYEAGVVTANGTDLSSMIGGQK